jgi:hypothetical protein
MVENGATTMYESWCDIFEHRQLRYPRTNARVLEYNRLMLLFVPAGTRTATLRSVRAFMTCLLVHSSGFSEDLQD